MLPDFNRILCFAVFALSQFYFDKSAKEHAEYEKAMEEYKKTEAYNQFQGLLTFFSRLI